MHPGLLQKIHKNAHLWQPQSIAQRQDTQRRWRPLIGSEHDPQPSIGKKIANQPGWYANQPGAHQSSTGQDIEVIGPKSRNNANGFSFCATLEAPVRHAWYVTEAQTIVLNEILWRRWLATPHQIAR